MPVAPFLSFFPLKMFQTDFYQGLGVLQTDKSNGECDLLLPTDPVSLSPWQFPSLSVLVPPLDVLKGAETEGSDFDIRLELRKKSDVHCFSFEWFWPAGHVSSWGWALLALAFTANPYKDQMNPPLILSSYSISPPDFYFCFQQRRVHISLLFFVPQHF